MPTNEITKAAIPVDGGLPAAGIRRRRQAEWAGMRLFRELVPARVLWNSLMEVQRLVAADLYAILAPVAACTHPPPCELTHCQRHLGVRAVIGNRHPATAGLVVERGDGTVESALAMTRTDLDSRDPLHALAAAEGLACSTAYRIAPRPDEIEVVLVVGRRAAKPLGVEEHDLIDRLGVFVAAALAAARDRTRAEDIAVARERRRIAKDLHDTLGQMLFGAGVTARLARESAGTGRADTLERIYAIERQIGQTTATLRHALRTLDSAPVASIALGASISEEIESLRHRSGIRAYLVIIGEARPVARTAEALLLRIAAEGLCNVERHSGAREVIVSIAFDADRVTLAVQDDGVGPATAATDCTGLGISRLREDCERQQGDLTLMRNEDGGATLRAWVSARA